MTDEKKEKIPEVTYTAEDLEYGGNYVQRFNPADFISSGIKQKVFTVKSFKGNAVTEWGKRGEWIITDDYDEFLLSSWAFITKEKVTSQGMVGKRIKLMAKDDRKVILEYLD